MNYLNCLYYAETVRSILILFKNKPAAVQKNTVKPAAIEIKVRVYYNDYGNHRDNTEAALLERFSSGRPELRYNDIFRDFFLCTSALIADVLFIGVFDGSVLLCFSTFQIFHRKREMGH